MKEGKKKTIYVIGHKNPDTDSICSAIAYAELKKKTTKDDYVAKRAGDINQETRFVLSHFGIKAPDYISNVRTQVVDIVMNTIAGVNDNLSLKKAWSLMREQGIATLPITREDKLEGLITIGDIAQSYMDVYDSNVLARARTQYRNMLETLDGKMVVGNEHAYFIKGKVVIAAANPDLMEDIIEDDDLVILGNRYESQLCAIEMNASCLIVCDGAKVSKTIQKLAEQKSCIIISSPHDTFTVARLINQSIPIKFFMRDGNITSFQPEDYVENIRDIMAKKRHRNFPIINKKEEYVGMISRRDLLSLQRKRIIMVDHNEASQAVDGIEEAEILEIIDHHRLGALQTISPVYFRNQPLGCTATILYQMYNEQEVKIESKIAGLLCSAIISDTLMFRSPTCTEKDREAATELADLAGIDIESFAQEMFKAGSDLQEKSDEEIFFQDYKKFYAGDENFAVGQINSMDQSELITIRERLIPYIEQSFQEQDNDMLFFMLTNIIDESTELLCYGNNAVQVIEKAFDVTCEAHVCILNGVVSRKKQLVPALVTTLQQ